MIGIVRKDFIKYYCLIKKTMIVVQRWKTSQALIIGMQKEYLKTLIIKI